MNFGSEFILNDENEEQTEASAAEPPVSRRPVEDYYDDNSGGFECEIMDFDEDEEDFQSVVKEKKINTNTVKMEMKKLQEKPDIMVEKSKLVECQRSSCGAIYSHLAKTDDGKKVWICNFCEYENEVKGELPELSDKTDVMYLEDISNPPEVKPPDSNKLKIIFVMDTSSSMSITKSMPVASVGTTLRGIVEKDNEKQKQQLQNVLQGPLPIEAPPSNNIEVSRLQAIKAGVIEAIEKLRKSEQGFTQVGLVTFAEKVVVYGDGRHEVFVEGGQLADLTELQSIGERYSNLDPVLESAENLKQKIEKLDDIGRTALGPALVIAQRMASSAVGSKVILCTDGLANIGLGKLEETTDKDINEFYTDVIAESIKLGVSISIICVDNAGLNTKLGQVPTETGGVLEKIQATDLDKTLSEELKRATVAINADITFVVHKDLYVDDTKDTTSKCSQYCNKIGNLQLDKQMSFSFAFKPNNQQPPSDEQPKAEKQATEESKAKSDDQLLPFQVQIKYDNVSGVKVVRVWTAARKLTKNRTEAEDAMSQKTVIENFIQTSSQKIWDEVYARREYVTLADNFSQSGFTHKNKLGNHDPETLKKLAKFIELMTSIYKSRTITEDQIAQLNSMKDARSSQVQG